MFALELETSFCAAHAILIRGERERTHGHTFCVRAVVEGRDLDDDGMLCDFHAIERWLHEIVRPFINNDLNATAPFDQLNPTAEHVARHIADELATRLSPGLRVASVRVTEAPGCSATYRPD